MSDDALLTLDQVLALRGSAAGPVVNVDEPVVKLVVFTLGETWYAVAAENVAEVLADCPVFFLPGCPSSLEGVINVRGDIESVLGLRTLLSLPAAAAGAPSCILLGRAAAMRSGLRVDTVEDVLDVLEGSIQPPPHTLSEPLKSLVNGIAAVRGHIVTVLDLERLLADYRAGLG